MLKALSYAQSIHLQLSNQSKQLKQAALLGRNNVVSKIPIAWNGKIITFTLNNLGYYEKIFSKFYVIKKILVEVFEKKSNKGTVGIRFIHLIN